MAKKSKKRVAPKVKLPPFPWETEVTLADGTSAALARAPLRQDTVEEGIEVSGDRVIIHRARVWRTKQPPMMKILNPAYRAAIGPSWHRLELTNRIEGGKFGRTGS